MQVSFNVPLGAVYIFVVANRYFCAGSPVNMALKCGVSVFYEVLKYINMEARLFPPTCQFFTTCVQVLGQVSALSTTWQGLYCRTCTYGGCTTAF